MATTSSEPAGDLEITLPGGRTQLAAASLSHHKRFTGLPTEAEGDGQASGPTQYSPHDGCCWKVTGSSVSAIALSIS